MEYPISNPSGNKMLSLVNESYQRSAGMCRAGAGPYGIGVSVVEDTPFDVFSPLIQIRFWIVKYCRRKSLSTLSA